MTGEDARGVLPVNVKQRKNMWHDCIVNEEINLYWHIQLPDIIDKFHQQLGIQDYTYDMRNNKHVMEKARKTIIEILQYTHVIPSPGDLCIIPQRRSVRHTSDRDLVDQSAALPSSLLTESLKKVKQRRRRERNAAAVSDLSHMFENTTAASTDPKAQKQEEMMTKLEFKYLKDLWLSGNDDDKVEVGRLEFLFLGALAGDSCVVTNAKIRQYDALPISVPDYDALNNIDVGADKKRKKRVLGRKKQSFDRLRNEIINKDSNGFVLREDKPILEWVRTFQLFNAGEDLLPKTMMKNGQLTPEAAACIRHICE